MLDVAVRTYPGMEIVAVADEDPEGLKKAAERLRTRATYSDYGKMLRAERPDIAVIGPRWPDCHVWGLTPNVMRSVSTWRFRHSSWSMTLILPYHLV